MRKIISNYEIVIDPVKDNDSEQSISTVIKTPVYQKEETKIDHSEVTSKLREPKLQLTRNNEGVVVGIEVSCACGDKILIKMDYK